MPFILLALLLLAVPAPQAPPTTWSIVVPPPGEPGEPLILTGVIYTTDGETPAPGAILHLYQADARGLYNEEGAIGGAGGANARLKGALRADASGRYEFRTIRPGSYPGTRILAHIHASVEAPGAAERSIADFHFDGDPFLSQSAIERARAAGTFSPIVSLTKGDDGVWRGRRDIRIPSGS